MQVDVARVRRHPDQLTILKTWPQMATSSTEDLDEVWIGWLFFFFSLAVPAIYKSSQVRLNLSHGSDNARPLTR